MSCKVIQANLNHSRGAQDLFQHTMVEEGCGLGILSEPYSVREGPKCAGSIDGTVAIIWRDAAGSPPLQKLRKGKNYVAVTWGPIVVIGVYLPPSLQQRAFNARLRTVGRIVRGLPPGPVIIAGDFNAKSGAWGSPRTDRRGDQVLDWAAEHGLHILNTGAQNICVRMRGGSIVDLSWANPSAERIIRGWKVATEKKTMSDHLYVEFSSLPLSGRSWSVAKP